jgi:hypothetical protein
MIKNNLSGAYKAPKCETESAFLEELLCQSPTGTTEDFGQIDDFTW